MTGDTQKRVQTLLEMAAKCGEAPNVILTKDQEVMLAESRIVLDLVNKDLAYELRIVQMSHAAIDIIKGIQQLYIGG